MVRFQGTNLRALAEKAGPALVEQSLPLYATQGRCAVEVQLNAWSLDKFCPWHDHDCKELGLIVVQGNLLEERWVRGKILRRLLQPGELVLLEPSTIHRLGGGKAVTLHAYGGGLRRMTRYQCGADGAPLLAGGLPAIEAVWAR